MKFAVDRCDDQAAGLFGCFNLDKAALIGGDTGALEVLLRAYSGICGAETKQRLYKAIDKYSVEDLTSVGFVEMGVDYSDTPLRGRHYVYAWFDATGELFYVGKGSGNRATTKYGRKDEFWDRAEGGCCRCVAYHLNEIYALDLERVLIWESLLLGKRLLNINGGDGSEAIQYCKRDRDAILWYWNHAGTIDCFARWVGAELVYDARDIDVSEIIEGRRCWWTDLSRERTNDPVVLEDLRKKSEKEAERRRKAQEAAARRRAKKLAVESPEKG